MSAIRVESKRYFATLGSHITQLRKQRGMTQAELARAVGVSQQAVFAYELGERRTSVLVLSKIAKAFGVPIVRIPAMADTSTGDGGQRRSEATQVGGLCSRLSGLLQG